MIPVEAIKSRKCQENACILGIRSEKEISLEAGGKGSSSIAGLYCVRCT